MKNFKNFVMSLINNHLLFRNISKKMSITIIPISDRVAIPPFKKVIVKKEMRVILCLFVISFFGGLATLFPGLFVVNTMARVRSN